MQETLENLRLLCPTNNPETCPKFPCSKAHFPNEFCMTKLANGECSTGCSCPGRHDWPDQSTAAIRADLKKVLCKWGSDCVCVEEKDPCYSFHPTLDANNPELETTKRPIEWLKKLVHVETLHSSANRAVFLMKHEDEKVDVLLMFRTRPLRALSADRWLFKNWTFVMGNGEFNYYAFKLENSIAMEYVLSPTQEMIAMHCDPFLRVSLRSLGDTTASTSKIALINRIQAREPQDRRNVETNWPNWLREKCIRHENKNFNSYVEKATVNSKKIGDLELVFKMSSYPLPIAKWLLDPSQWSSSDSHACLHFLTPEIGVHVEFKMKKPNASQKLPRLHAGSQENGNQRPTSRGSTTAAAAPNIQTPAPRAWSRGAGSGAHLTPASSLSLDSRASAESRPSDGGAQQSLHATNGPAESSTIRAAASSNAAPTPTPIASSATAARRSSPPVAVTEKRRALLPATDSTTASESPTLRTHARSHADAAVSSRGAITSASGGTQSGSNDDAAPSSSTPSETSSSQNTSKYIRVRPKWVDDMILKRTEKWREVSRTDEYVIFCDTNKWLMPELDTDFPYLVVYTSDPKLYDIMDLREGHISLVQEMQRVATEALIELSSTRGAANEVQCAFHYEPQFAALHMHVFYKGDSRRSFPAHGMSYCDYVSVKSVLKELEEKGEWKPPREDAGAEGASPGCQGAAPSAAPTTETETSQN